jgi:hypothetical protein
MTMPVLALLVMMAVNVSTNAIEAVKVEPLASMTDCLKDKTAVDAQHIQDGRSKLVTVCIVPAIKEA